MKPKQSPDTQTRKARDKERVEGDIRSIFPSLLQIMQNNLEGAKSGLNSMFSGCFQ